MMNHRTAISRACTLPRIAFYASTRTYRSVMELHGWGDVCDRLHEYSARGKWDKMGSEITPDILDEFVVEASWEQIGKRITEKVRRPA